MKRNNLIVLFALLCLLTTSCLEIPMGYTPYEGLQTIDSPSKKYNLTYSVDFLSDGDVSIGRASREKYIEWIKEYLEETGAFNVSYRDFSSKSNYHVHFLVHYSAISVGEGLLLGFYWGYTLTTLPSWVNMYLDVSAVVYLNGTPVCSPSTSEDIRVIVWLPFLPVSLVWNQWWAWTTQERKCCRFLINEILEKHEDLVLNPPKTQTSKVTTSSNTNTKSPPKTTATKTNDPGGDGKTNK